MSPLEKIIRISQQIEKTLESEYGANGRGLHEKATSVEHKLSPSCLKKIHMIATVRNQVVHEDADLARGELDKVTRVAKEVNREIQKSQGCIKPLIRWLIATVVLIGILALGFIALKTYLIP